VYVFRDDLVYAVLILWWAKPVCDRVVLHVLSRAVFGEVIPVRRVLAEWREFLAPGLLAGQLWARIDAARSFDLPVWQLERLRGRAAARRRGVLQRRTRYHAVWLTGMCAMFESILILGCLLAVSELLTPVKATSGWLFENLFKPASGETWRIEAVIAYTAAVTVIEPFYVAGGFALYLNRRTLLEGWDIELELRRCAARAADGKARAAALAAAVLVAAALAIVQPQAATAGEAAPGKSAKQEIAEVLKEPEFPHLRETWGWKMRWPDWEAPGWLRWPDWLTWSGKTPGSGAALRDILVALAKLLFWGTLAAALVWVIFYLARRLPYLLEPDPGRSEPPAILFGLDIAPETLPADVAGAAAQLLAAGQVRDALSLLYRGALSALVHAKGMPLQAGDTERDCLRRARDVLPREGQAFFVELIAAWEATAYAGRLPDPGRAQGLVSGWAAHFTPASA
jgi:hypothetical protein